MTRSLALVLCNKPWVLGLAVAGLLWGCQSAAPVTDSSLSVAPPAQIVFDDAVEITNGIVRLAVSPAAGRVVSFGYAGGENLLWINQDSIYDPPTQADAYYNIGGDKLWVAPQPLWKNAFGHDNWPPDGVIDGQAWILVEQTNDSLTIQSPESPDYGVVVRRTFHLPPKKSQAVITNAILRIHANPHPLQIWSVTQIKQPRAAVLDLAPDAPAMPSAYITMTDETPAKVAGYVQTLGENAAIEWTQQGNAHAKLGSLGRWVAGVYDGMIFRQSTDFDPNGAYPEASSVQVYRAGDYTELELLSPLIQLAPGETLTNTVTWALMEMTEELDANAFLLAADPK
ncbi:MAG: DUF4380 domain-containing protein [Planctomycetota bacterium]